MKKILTLFLAFAMLLALAACGGPAGTQTTSSPEPDTQTTSSPDPDTQTTSSGENAGNYPTMELKIAMAATETSDEAESFKVLTDYVTEHTNGAITFKVYYNGSFCAQNEEMDYVSAGTIDLHYNLVAQNPEKTIVRQAFGNTLTVDGVNEMFDYVLKENPETSAILEQECTEQNLKLLGVWNSGATVFLSTKPLTSLDDLRGTVYGADMGTEAIAALGVSTQSVLLTDIYESLSRGVIDSTSITLPGAIALKWYEVADNVLYISMAAPSHQLEMNLDTWNELGPDAQKVFEEAVKLSETTHLERVHASEEAMLEVIRDAGGTISEVNDADKSEYLQIIYDQKYKTFYPMAEAAGKGEEFVKVLDAVAGFSGITINK